MKKVFKGILACMLVAIMLFASVPTSIFTEIDFGSVFHTMAVAIEEFFSPPYKLNDIETVAINFNGQQYDDLSLSTQSLRLNVGDSERFFVEILDENDQPVENFQGLSWWAYPSSAVKLEVNEADTRYCTVTILETDASVVTIYASAYGQTLESQIEIIGNGLNFSSDEYYILVGTDDLVVSFELTVLSQSKATWTTSEDVDSITESDYEFKSSDESILSVTGKSHSFGSWASTGGCRFDLYPKVMANKEGTVTLTVSAGQDEDTCTVHVVLMKDYKIEAFSKDLEMPIPEADINADVYITNSVGTKSDTEISGTTGDDGIVILRLPDVSIVPEFEISGEAEFHPLRTIMSKELKENEINKVELDFKMDIPAVTTPEGSVSTLGADLGDSIVDMLSFEFSMDFGDKVKVSLDLDYRELKIKGTIEGTLDKTESTINKDQPLHDNDKPNKEKDTRLENYKEYKNLFEGLLGKKDMQDSWLSLRKQAEKQNATFGISAQVVLVGYIELGFSTGKVEVLEGGLVVSATGSFSKRMPTGWPAVYVAFEISGGVEEGGFIFKKLEAGGIGINVSVSFTFGASAGAGVSIAKVAEVEIGLEGKFKFTFNFTVGESMKLKDILKITADLDGYLEYKVKAWIIKFGDKLTVDLAYAELYPNLSAELLIWKTNSLSDEYFELMPRDYLSEDVIRTYSYDYAEEFIINTYPNGVPQIEALDNGNKVSVWLADNGNKSNINRTTLMYSVFDGSTWSEAKAVYESGKFDDIPEMCSDGKNVYALWSRGKKIFSDDTMFEEYIKNVELVYSVFDGKSWSEPVVISNNNDRYQSYYSIAANDGDVTVSWTENDENNVFLNSGNTTIYQRDMLDGSWQTPKQVCTTTKPINAIASGFRNNIAGVVYSIDTDGDSLTMGDNAVYFNSECIAKESGTDFLGTRYADGKFYFVANDELCIYDGELTETGVSVGAKYNLISDGNDYAVISRMGGAYESELYVSYSDNGVDFTSPVQLTSYGNHISSFDAVLNDDGTITLSSNVRNLVSEHEFGHTDLVIETFENSKEIELIDAGYNLSLHLEDRDILFGAVVKNQGKEDINYFDIILEDDKGNQVYSKRHYEKLASGESKEIDFRYDLPENEAFGDFTIRVSTNDDNDLTNNQKVFSFEIPDVTVENAQITGDGYLTAQVKNIGNTQAEDVTVTFSKLNGAIYEKLHVLNIDNIAVGESKTVSYKVPQDKISFKSYIDNNSFMVECSGGSGDLNYANNDVTAILAPNRVTAMTLDQQNVVMVSGDTIQLNGQFTPANATDKTIYWFSSNDKVVAVDENGNISAVALGNAEIKAVSADGKFEDTCNVTVSTNVPVTGVSVNPAELTVLVGNTSQLVADIKPVNATNKGVTWSTNNYSVASVNSSTGVITAKNAGTAIITAKTADGGYTSTCRVTVVTAPIAVTGIKLNQSSAVIYAGEVFRLIETVSPSNATNKNVTWESTDTNVVTVSDSGFVTAIAKGTAEVKVRTEDGGFVAICLVNVMDKDVPVTGIEIQPTSLELTVGNSAKFNAVVKPTNATNKNVVWSSSDNRVAYVDNNGMVTALKAGQATISVTSLDGNYTAQCHVVVKAMVGHGKIVDVQLNSRPNTVNYKYKYKSGINLAGLTLKVIYEDGFSEIITDTSKMAVSGYDTSSTGEKVINVMYENFTVSFNITVKYTLIQWIIVILLFGWLWY